MVVMHNSFDEAIKQLANGMATNSIDISHSTLKKMIHARIHLEWSSIKSSPIKSITGKEIYLSFGSFLHDHQQVFYPISAVLVFLVFKSSSDH